MLSFGVNMKFKYFTLILILTFLFSLGSVMASEDANQDSGSFEGTYLSIDTVDNQYSASDDGSDNIPICYGSDSDGLQNQNSNDNLIREDSSDGSSNDEVNLSVDMKIGETVKHTGGIGELFFDVPFIITASVDNGTVHNVTIRINLPDEFKYVSHDKTVGTYDSETGIWKIGDLSSNMNATLTIMTNLTKKGFYVVTVNTTANSNDTNLTVNDLKCEINATSKISSGISRTSRHLGANHASRPTQRVPDPEPEPTPTPEPEPTPTPEPEPTPGSKSTVSFTNMISGILSSLLDSNGTDTNSTDSNLSTDVVKAIASQDYIKTPILIFVVFLVVILGAFGYDKFKS